MDQEPNKSQKRLIIIAVSVVVAAALTWAVATLFEIAFAKALACVILLLFAIVVALFMIGMF